VFLAWSNPTRKLDYADPPEAITVFYFERATAFMTVNSQIGYLIWDTKGHEKTYIANHQMAGGHSDRRPLFFVSPDALPSGIAASPSAKG
jgi:hypothetical protein